MERRGKRKEWVVPELLVLVRSHPEEAVLATCKIHPEVGSTFVDGGCYGDPCSPCTDISSS
jgi:hypothetical protein